MQEWFSSTLYLSREVRQATSQLLRNEEYEDVALKYIHCETSLRSHSPMITIIGTGVVGSSMMNMLLTSFPELSFEWIYHYRKPDVPSEFQNRIKISQIEKLPEISKNSDIIISAVRTDNPVITNDNRFVFRPGSVLIDLSLPRSIDPEIKNNTENIKVLDLDGLKKWYRIEQVNRDDLLSICNKIVHTNRDIYDKLITSITGRNSQ
jgi:glutamyl-tRNA reductase